MLRFPLVTERLELRPQRETDAGELIAIYADPEVTRYFTAGIHDVRAAIANAIQLQAQNGFSVWSVIERSSGAVVGKAGLQPLEQRGPQIEIGYTLGRQWWGMGYATEAARASLDVGLGELGLERVVAVVHPDNTRSQRVMEKLGMLPAGRRLAYATEHLFYVTPAPGSPPESR